MSKKQKIQNYLNEIEDILKGLSVMESRCESSGDIEKLEEIKKSLNEGNLPNGQDKSMLFALKKVYDNVLAPLLQLNQDIQDGKTTKEEALVEKDKLLDPERKF